MFCIAGIYLSSHSLGSNAVFLPEAFSVYPDSRNFHNQPHLWAVPPPGLPTEPDDGGLLRNGLHRGGVVHNLRYTLHAVRPTWLQHWTRGVRLCSMQHTLRSAKGNVATDEDAFLQQNCRGRSHVP